MKWAIFLLFSSAVCLTLWLWQTDNHLSETGYLRLKNALDMATHDASLQLNKEVLENEGGIAFSDVAWEAFNESLQRNLRLDASGHPLHPGLFRSSDALEVLLFDKVEKGCPDSPAGFPCTYVNHTYGYVDMLEGPGIVAIIRMHHPRPFAFSPDTSYIVGSSHEYKGP
ncbi:hypothetical protein [Gorillibacterium massiliense]|uniref:hypothetical protein n=1 Tax=Gorillibacterium massiliense TaxID=1280390 RepID=UPI0004BCE670|nr:hypothetical protein [Gorillibacterium massiliense]